jgi:S1-C subfamily serine protease
VFKRKLKDGGQCAAAMSLLLLAWASPAVGQSAIAEPEVSQFQFGPMLNRVLPGVVGIYVIGREPVEIDNAFYDHPAVKSIGQSSDLSPKMKQTSSLGSGVIVLANEVMGYILTNHHVIENGEQFGVKLLDGRRFNAELVGKDPATDVAVLKINGRNLTTVPIGQAATASLGDVVFAIGNPLGLSSTVTMGVVSSLLRSTVGWRNFEAYIQHDASVNPGNSGGALINTKGELIGINTSIRSPTSGSVGLSFAQPIGLMLKIGSQIVKYGKAQRGDIGITTSDMTPARMAQLNVPVSQGAVIDTVRLGSAADLAGLKSGDTIVAVRFAFSGPVGDMLRTSFGDFPIHSRRALETAVGIESVGDKLMIGVYRGGEKKAFALQVDKLPTEVERHTAPETDVRLRGLVVSPLGPSHPNFGETTGVVIIEVKKDSIAQFSGLLPGDIVMRVDGQRAGTPNDFFEMSGDKGRKPELKVLRGSVPIIVRFPI